MRMYIGYRPISSFYFHHFLLGAQITHCDERLVLYGILQILWGRGKGEMVECRFGAYPLSGLNPTNQHPRIWTWWSKNCPMLRDEKFRPQSDNRKALAFLEKGGRGEMGPKHNPFPPPNYFPNSNTLINTADISISWAKSPTRDPLLWITSNRCREG